MLVSVHPIARKEEHAKNEKRKQSQHYRNGIGRFDLAFIELCKDV
jgi:hypothetical protein